MTGRYGLNILLVSILLFALFVLPLFGLATIDPVAVQKLAEDCKFSYGDYFGMSASLSGDTAIIAAPGFDDNGAAFVFVRSETSCWAQQAKLVNSDTSSRYFGGSVSLSDDTVVVAAPYHDSGGPGVVYIFVRSGTSWSEQSKLTAPEDGSSWDEFGTSVSVSGDTMIISARDLNADGNILGAAYVFVRSGESWSEQAKLTASDGSSQDEFGTSVSVSGDTAIVGTDSDSAYIFVRSGTSWTEQVKITASDTTEGGDFSGSVSISGDTALIGTSSGSILAYVFVRSGTSWSEQAKLSTSDEVKWGFSASLFDDTAAISAYGVDADGDSFRAAYVFMRSGTSWSEQSKLTASNGTYGFFGWSVATSEDSALITAPYDENGGAAYIFGDSCSNSYTQRNNIPAVIFPLLLGD